MASSLAPGQCAARQLTYACDVNRSNSSTAADGFDVRDVHHRQTLFTLGKLAALVARLRRGDADAEARAMAREIVEFFSTTSRPHHEDEEKHVFPGLLDSGDPQMVQNVLRLQQDHHWLAVDWLELSAPLNAVANGQSVDLDQLHDMAQVFIALSHDHIALEESCIYPQARARLQERERRKPA
jgi:hemerythrin-like domain-containing protein